MYPPFRGRLPLLGYLFPVVPRLFHRAGRASPSIAIEFPLFPVFPECKKGIQESALITLVAGTENIGNTLKAFAEDWEQTGNRLGTALGTPGTTIPPPVDISIPAARLAYPGNAPSPGSGDSGRCGSCRTASTVPAASAGIFQGPR